MENITFIWGQTSRLLSPAQGGPAPVITWYRGGRNETILQNSTSVTYRTTLYSPEAYTCDAQNSFGSAKKVLMVNIQSKWFNGDYFAFTCSIPYVESGDSAVMTALAAKNRRHAYVGRV